MSPRAAGKTQQCGTDHARTRIAHARAFLEVADLVGAEHDNVATPGVAAALAVLAGIAASDAACCAVLGERSRGQDHRQAVDLLGQIVPGGKAMARDLDRLLSIKDDAHFGMLHIGAQRAKAALRQARSLVEAAAKHVD
jgi:hypothetical protein